MQDQLGLTAVQREQILAHRHIKLVSLARLLQDRRELQLKLQVHLCRPRNSHCSGITLSVQLRGCMPRWRIRAGKHARNAGQRRSRGLDG